MKRFEQPQFTFAAPTSVCDYVACTGSDNGYKPKGDPPVATKAEPGSEAKIQILVERLKAGVELWHKDDLTDEGRLAELLKSVTQIQSSEYSV